MKTVSRAFDSWLVTPGFPKAAWIATRKRWHAETATPSRGYGTRQKAETGSSASSWPPSLCSASSVESEPNDREFFGRLHLETQVGCSPSALRSVMQTLEQSILQSAAVWEPQGIAQGEIRPIIGAVDETFLQRMILVFMDLTSGYLLMEEMAVNRTYETWDGLVKARLKTFGVEVSYLVSDRAKALIKLAETGLDCLSIPDVFHLSHELAKAYSLAIFGRMRQAQQALTQAGQRLATLQASHPGSDQAQQAQALVEVREAEMKRWEAVRNTYRNHLTNLSRPCTPGAFWTRPARPLKRLKASYRPKSRRLQR